MIVLICFCYESIKFIRSSIRKKQANNINLTVQEGQRQERKLTQPMIIDSLLHVIQLSIGYSLMLVIMTYNVWLCLATVIGEAIALLFFRVLFPELDTSNTIEGTCCG